MTSEIFDIPEENKLDNGSLKNIRFSVEYQKEGMNYGTGEVEERGFYFYSQFCTAHSPDVVETTLFGDDSFKILIFLSKRNSQKKQKKLFEHFDKQRLLEKMKEGKKELIDEILLQAKTID